MSLFEKYIKGVRFILPTPFTIAILLTVFTMVFAIILPWENNSDNYNNLGEKIILILNYWNKGLWNINGLAFAIQMMLMLLFGYVLALSPIIDKLINKLLPICKDNAKSATVICLLTLTVSWFNWGLGLVFGAVFCKKIMQYASEKNISLNAGLIGAAGYCGLMIWHGGISGSSLIKITEPGHISSLASENIKSIVPELIDFNSTVFSTMNLAITTVLLIILPFLMYLIGKRVKTEVPKFEVISDSKKTEKNLIGAEKIDHSLITGKIIGISIFCLCIYLAFQHPSTKSFQFITPNFLNLTLLGMAIFFHGSIIKFLKATENAIGSTVGILIQFPLYFGIMGIFQSTGIIQDFSEFFQNISNETTYPIFTFISAGIVNFFVPSGGGQWYIQGPLVIQSAIEMGIPLNKSIMALAYGDQLTNMMQPFWAIPLLGITGLKAKDILPFTFILMIVGFMVFTIGLFVF
tara:strand:+ start:367 stop:1758 length:1392 start_codon:yes stop_codon:yes gene_type:complete